MQYITLRLTHITNFLHTFVDCEDLVKGGIHLLHRKTVADAFWNAELEDELRQRGWIKSPFVVPSDRERLMQEVDKVRAVSIYSHEVCSKDCQMRGEFCCTLAVK